MFLLKNLAQYRFQISELGAFITISADIPFILSASSHDFLFSGFTRELKIHLP